jgi:tetratricopeptide (TPR) repeat protein
MTQTHKTTDQSTGMQWTLQNAIILAAVCLLVGIAGGWMLGGLQTPSAGSVTAPAGDNGNPAAAGNAAPQISDAQRAQQMADSQATPMIEKLKASPNDPELLTSIGNVYYDAQLYAIAIDYYGRALKQKPADVSVRTDMATAYWYMGNADTAIDEYNKALVYEPTSPNALFNRGLVKWKGKSDAAGALADWDKLLKANPNYEQKDNVLKMVTEAKQAKSGKP